jgi:RES domain-containing protein
MIYWRASRHRDLEGRGGLDASGRWHTRGARIVYCAQSPAGALLEVMAHGELDFDMVPSACLFLKISAPDDTPLESVLILPAGWKTDLSVTREKGDEWLASARSSLLVVPSVIAPETFNVLINPLHPNSSYITVEKTYPYTMDTRLLEILRSAGRTTV